MKVWVVYEEVSDFTYHGDYITNRTVCKIFDSEEKAVNCIREKIHFDHEGMENCELNFDRENYVRFEFYKQNVTEGEKITSYEYYDETVRYVYESISVE